MNNTFFNPIEEVVPIFARHDNSMNVDNLLQKGEELHLVEAT
jgi:hypothetical protein